LKPSNAPLKAKTEALAELFELEAGSVIELFFGDGSGILANARYRQSVRQFRGEEFVSHRIEEPAYRLSNRANRARMWTNESR